MRLSLLVTSFLTVPLLGGALSAQTAAPKRQAPQASTATGQPTIGTYGFDVAGMDRSVARVEDFDRFASGHWSATTQIPADRSSWGMFHVLQDRSLEQTRAILEEAAKRPGAKIGDFYTSYMDEAKIEALGLSPVKPWLAAIAGAKDKDALVGEAGKLQTMGVGGVFSAGRRARTARRPIPMSSWRGRRVCRYPIVTIT